MLSGSIKVIDGVTCNATATVYSLIPEADTSQPTNSWLDCKTGESYSIWVYGSSATGTISVNVYADLSPLSSGIAYDSTDLTKYVPILLSSQALATDSAMTHYTSASTSYDNLNYPFCKMRIRVVGSATNPADSVITCYITVANSGL